MMNSKTASFLLFLPLFPLLLLVVLCSLSSLLPFFSSSPFFPFPPHFLLSAFSTPSFLSTFSFFPLLSSPFSFPSFLSFSCLSLIPFSPSFLSFLLLHLCHNHYGTLVLLQDPDAAQIQSSVPSSDCNLHDPYPMPELSLPCTAEAAFAAGRPQSVPAEGWWCGTPRSTFEGSSLQVPGVVVARISPTVTLQLLLRCLRLWVAQQDHPNRPCSSWVTPLGARKV